MENLERYKKLLDKHGIECKGKKMPYTSLNGHMYTFHDKEGCVSFRFDEPYLKWFLEEFDAKRSIQYNSVMRGYAIIPQHILEDEEELDKHFKASMKFIQSLPPKVTKKKS